MPLKALYKLTDAYNKQTIMEDLEKKTPFSCFISNFQRFELYDTFDWRLYRKERMFLSVDGLFYRLYDSANNSILEEDSIINNEVPAFWREFPENSLKSELKRIIDVRALLKIIDFNLKTEIYNATNDDRKTVVRIGFYELSGNDPSGKTCLMNTIEIIPLRGYTKEFCAIQSGIEQHLPNSLSEHQFLAFIREFGIEPGGYISKTTIPLQSGEQCNKALKSIFKQTLSVIRANEDGIKKDIDTEFVHDFRVAVRRTRAALSQIKNVFPKEQFIRFRDDFTFIGKFSNRLRDLDVYLLNKQYYFDLIPKEIRLGLHPLFETLEKERSKELASVIGHLNGNRYLKIVEDWEQFLNHEDDIDPTMTNASRPVVEVAKELILKRYENIIKSGGKIHSDTPDEKLHSLRIQCKKLRYLLEFFVSLFPREDIDRFIDQLKKMQDNLGNFNDLSVQQEDMKRHLYGISGDKKTIILESAAIGGLISLLKEKQKRVRKKFNSVFKDFSDKSNTILFHKLFD